VHIYVLARQNTALRRNLIAIEKQAAVRDREIAELAAFENTARLKYGMNTIADDVRKAGIGGAADVEDLLMASMEDPPVRHAREVRKKVEELVSRANLQDSTFFRLSSHVINQSTVLKQRPSIAPAAGRITSGFGYRVHPFFRQLMFHEGIDISNRMYTPVSATADGRIAEVKYSHDYGNFVKIEHPSSGYTTVYAHLQRAAVVEGQVVKRGEMIGYMGNTGRSTGPHVHYEVRMPGRFENPAEYILPVTAVVD
jgi:murein DD-endopeptidase MepM/ murein hydrolase activator NlpD